MAEYGFNNVLHLKHAQGARPPLPVLVSSKTRIDDNNMFYEYEVVQCSRGTYRMICFRSYVWAQQGQGGGAGYQVTGL